jgi:hypothetical protein
MKVMKTKKARFFMLSLAFAGFSLGMSAQVHLDALIKRCETLESVDMEMVKNKGKFDKNVETKTVNIRITNNKKLVYEFLDAFKKDSPNAEQAMFRKKKESGEINYYQSQFPKQTYTIVVKEAGNANITVGNPLRFQAKRSSTDSLRLDRLKQMQKQNQERIKKNQERIKQVQKQNQERIKQMKKQHQERIKQHKERIKQYKLRNMDSIIIKQNTIADSLIMKSSSYINSIKWDSITSKFGKDMDSLAGKLSVKWDEIMERYDF